MRDRVIDIGPAEFKKHGFMVLEDTTEAPIGSLRIMRNAEVTERGGLAPRPGTRMLGAPSSSTAPITGFYNFRKAFGSDELLVRTSEFNMDGEFGPGLEYISKDYESSGWAALNNGYTAGAEFGFVSSLVNTDNQDYLVGCNRYEPYFTWTGSVALLTETLAGGETVVTVDSTLLPDIFFSGTATSSTATTLDIGSALWAVSQWVNFYVFITDGVLVNKVRKITANTTTQITFDTLGGDPGDVTFEIRQVKFPATGTLVYEENKVPYTSIDTNQTFIVASAGPAVDGYLVTVLPTEYPAAPRGNRLANYLLRIFVGNVRSAMTRDAGGALQGYASAGSVFVSKIKTPTDFSFTATRVAGEGDVLSMPLGGGDVTDILAQEEAAYCLKARYIEADQYSQDANDLAIRTPLKAGFGSIGKTIRGVNDVFFFTADKQFTSLGRVKTKDIRPEVLNIGTPIKRFLEATGIDSTVGRGMEIGNKIYAPIKLLPTSEYNDVMLVYSRDNGSFEGIWDISAFGIEQWGEKFYYAESNGPNVYEMFTGHADVIPVDEGETLRFPIDFEVATNWMNLTASKAYLQALHGLVIEGWIGGGASFTTKVWKDFAADPFLLFNFNFDEQGFLDGEETQAFLGSHPFAIQPEAAVYGDPMSDGRRHFSFRVYIPFQYGNYFSVGFASSEADDDYEITRFGPIMKESPSVNANRIKYL